MEGLAFIETCVKSAKSGGKWTKYLETFDEELLNHHN